MNKRQISKKINKINPRLSDIVSSKNTNQKIIKSVDKKSKRELKTKNSQAYNYTEKIKDNKKLRELIHQRTKFDNNSRKSSNKRREFTGYSKFIDAKTPEKK